MTASACAIVMIPLAKPLPLKFGTTTVGETEFCFTYVKDAWVDCLVSPTSWIEYSPDPGRVFEVTARRTDSEDWSDPSCWIRTHASDINRDGVTSLWDYKILFEWFGRIFR